MYHIDNSLESAYSYPQLTREGTMPKAQALYEPPRTKHLLAKLNRAIEEARLVKEIVALNDELHRIEYLSEQADRVRFIRKSIINLEGRLSDVRERAL